MKRASALLLVATACGAPPPAQVHNAATPPPVAYRRALGKLAPIALQGPFRTLGEFCADCLPPYRPLVTRGPDHIDRAYLVAHASEPTWGPRCALAVERDNRTWVDDDLELHCLARPGQQSIIESVAIDELAWREVVRDAPAGEAIGPELVLAVTTQRRSGGGFDAVEKQLVVCGTGASQHPSCTPPIPVETHGVSVTKFGPTIASDGTLTFHIDDPDDEMSDRADYEQPQLLVFP